MWRWRLYSNSPNGNRNYYSYQEVRKIPQSEQIPGCLWDYQGSFGLSKVPPNYSITNEHPLINALGLTAPTRQALLGKTDSVGSGLCWLYCRKILDRAKSNGGTINFIFLINPTESIVIPIGSGQYSCGFQFSPDKDLSKLKNQNYA